MKSPTYRRPLSSISSITLLFVLSVSAVFIAPIIISNIGFRNSFDLEDPRVVRLSGVFDINDNKIQDSFELNVNFKSTEIIETVVSFGRKPTSDDRIFIETLGGQWLKEFNVIYAAHVLIPAFRLPALAKFYSVSSISANSMAKSLLYISNYQVRARNATWLQQFNGLNLTGFPGFATAVLDTGVDANHPDLASQVIAWKDFAGRDALVSGDEYANPTDFGHHGTHVAGIISGQGNSSKNGYMNISKSGLINTKKGYWNYGPTFIKPDSASRDLIIKQSWNKTFASIVGYDDPVGIGDSSPISNNSQVSFPIAGSGNYRTYVGGNDQVNIDYDISFVAQTDFPVPIPTDGFGTLAGIAPSSKIVGLKVLDDLGMGTKVAVLNAFDWCIANKTALNITVINLSLGFETIEQDMDDAIEVLVRTEGIVVVAAAGNNGKLSTKIGSPGSAPHAITVGAVNRLNEVTDYSSIGSSKYNNIVVKPDVTAPGGSYLEYPFTSSPIPNEIYACDSNFDDIAQDSNEDFFWVDNKTTQDKYKDDYTPMVGTSMATPHVSGIAQLLIQRLAANNGGNWTWSGANALKVKQLLSMSTSESAALGIGGEYLQNPTLDRGEKDYTEGWGRIDTLSAINLATEIASFQEKTFTFSNKTIGPRVEALNLKLVKNIQYQFDLEMLDNNSDMDVFIYQTNPSQNGEPVQVAKSANIGRGVNEQIKFTPISTGNYYLIIRWANGTGISSAIISSPSFNEALDNTDLSFSSGGENPWFFQTAITHDGEDAMQSGIVSNGKASWISSTLMGPGNITFYWKINAGSNDKVVFTTDGIQNTSKFGNSDWSTHKYNVGWGKHTLTWNYSRGSLIPIGDNAAWLDEVSYVINIQEHNATIEEITPNPSTDGLITLKWTPIIGATKYYIFRETSSINSIVGLKPRNESDVVMFQDNITTNGTYYYRVIATNGTHNSTISNEVSVTVAITPPPEIPDEEDGFVLTVKDMIYIGIAVGVVAIILGFSFRSKKKKKLNQPPTPPSDFYYYHSEFE